MSIFRNYASKLGILFLVMQLVCSLYALDKKNKECHLENTQLSNVQVAPFDIDGEPEIDFVDGVPIFPWARPVVILQGSDFDMGFQYAIQLVQIFGAWILELLECDFSDRQARALKGYEWYIKKYAPEMIGFFEGMVKGARDQGVTLTYEEVLAQFCLGVKGKGYMETPSDQAKYPGEIDKAERSFLPSLDTIPMGKTSTKCGSVAAWGKASKDGKVITSASSDGDDHFNMTVICFPEEGNAYSTRLIMLSDRGFRPAAILG